jgi:glutaredoxin
VTSLLTRLLFWSPQAKHLRFTVYTRAQCCLCHEALELIKGYQQRYGFSIEEVDIDAEADLLARYDTLVPVVAVNGKIRFRGIVTPVLLERLLRAESRRRSTTSERS